MEQAHMYSALAMECTHAHVYIHTNREERDLRTTQVKVFLV